MQSRKTTFLKIFNSWGKCKGDKICIHHPTRIKSGFYVKSTFKSFFFLLNCFHFIFFLKFGCFFPLAQLAIKTRYIIIYQVSSGQVNPVIWVNFLFFFSWYEIIKCWCFWRQIEVIMIIMLRWPKQQKFGCNGQRARLVWTF